MDSRLNLIMGEIDSILSDSGVPKNIKKALLDSKERLLSEDEWNVKISSAIYYINNISEDINMPAHARMQVWTILGELESLKE